MGFAVGSFAKVWRINEESSTGSGRSAQISTSRKNKDGTYITDFNAYVMFHGKAKEVLEQCKEGDSIKIIQCGVQNKYDKEASRERTWYSIFECERHEYNAERVKAAPYKKNNTEEGVDGSPEELPF